MSDMLNYFKSGYTCNSVSGLLELTADMLHCRFVTNSYLTDEPNSQVVILCIPELYFHHVVIFMSYLEFHIVILCT
jgi:hypothetical protein